MFYRTALIARFMGPTWGPFGADRTQVGPMLAPWTLLSGCLSQWLMLTWHGDWNYISIAHVIIIIKSEVSTFPIVIIFFCGCVPEMFVTSYSVTYCIYIPGKLGICFHYYCAVYDEFKYSDTVWLVDCTWLLVQYTISLSSLCKLIWKHWTYKMPVRYVLSSVWVRLSIFSP